MNFENNEDVNDFIDDDIGVLLRSIGNSGSNINFFCS